MEIRYLHAQALFGAAFGLFLAWTCGAPWWGFVIAAPLMSAAAYALSRLQLRTLALKPDIRFLDYLEARKNRWR